jgi:hypothetical protein
VTLLLEVGVDTTIVEAELPLAQVMGQCGLNAVRCSIKVLISLKSVVRQQGAT